MAELFSGLKARGEASEGEWRVLFESYKAAHPAKVPTDDVIVDIVNDWVVVDDVL